MNKNIVALIVGCLYVAASSWIVSSQGKAHREALKQAGTSRSAPVSSKPRRRFRRTKSGRVGASTKTRCSRAVTASEIFQPARSRSPRA